MKKNLTSGKLRRRRKIFRGNDKTVGISIKIEIQIFPNLVERKENQLQDKKIRDYSK